jgi:hypothetical protein
MVTLCLDTSLETLWPICYRHTHHRQEDLCHHFHEGSLQGLQAVATLLASHVLQKSPQFTVQEVQVWTPREPILGTDESWNVPLLPLLSCLGLVGRS